MCRKKTRFNPVELEFGRTVRFTSEELIDDTVVESVPQVLFL
jgi:hypothetical protein